MNCFVVTVLMTGLRQEFSGNKRKANMASRDGGTYMMVERSDKVVTVIEHRMLVTATTPSRAIT